MAASDKPKKTVASLRAEKMQQKKAQLNISVKSKNAKCFGCTAFKAASMFDPQIKDSTKAAFSKFPSMNEEFAELEHVRLALSSDAETLSKSYSKALDMMINLSECRGKAVEVMNKEPQEDSDEKEDDEEDQKEEKVPQEPPKPYKGYLNFRERIERARKF